MTDGLARLAKRNPILVLIAANLGRHEGSNVDEAPGQLEVAWLPRQAVELHDAHGVAWADRVSGQFLGPLAGETVEIVSRLSGAVKQ
jgi:hypothetical protein